MSHPITQGRRIRTVNGVGYNLTWLGEREGRLCRLIFDLHSFDLRTLEDIEQLIPLRKIHVACDISGREISAVLMPMSFSVPASTTEDDIRKMVFLRIAKDHPQLIEYIC